PVDNRETHLELTMVHEAMALEYSGRSLALIELAGHIKQMAFFTLITFFFIAPAPSCPAWPQFAVKIAVIALVFALVEISVAKMRLFRVVDFLTFSFFVALIATIAAGLGL
ncbi:MAG: NADH-quinone oxidoreductase subunit H, partial [Candidatus Omnitrophica bacterium]|nr:NADH-quinone oxidoreductase subunit H [Candidatus Omnitrophota bacterium]